MKHPPAVWAFLLEWIARTLEKPSLLGDMQEEYDRRAAESGRNRASAWYRNQVLASVPSFLKTSFRGGFIMIRNYLVTTLRNLGRQKSFALINIAGFAMGIACCILILLWVRDELSFDRFHERCDRLCRVVEYQHYSDGTVFPIARTPYALGPALKEDFPEVFEFSRYTPLGRNLMSSEDREFYENGIAFADPSLLKMFTFPLISGDAASALQSPDGLLISRRAADKYFPGEDPIGRILTLNREEDFRVAGVLADIPRASHLEFDFLGQFDRFIQMTGWDAGWNSNNYYTYLLLGEPAHLGTLAPKVERYLRRRFPESGTRLELQPLGDIHLRSHFAIDLGGKSENREKYVAMFSLVALLVLLIACFNFMNLATARSNRRALEIGVRKVVGARRANLVRQFLGESLFHSAAAVVIAAGLVALLLPAFNVLAGKAILLSALFSGPALAGLLGLVCVTGILSGLYPALFLSAFHPVRVLKGELRSSSGGSSLRKILVTLQFALSIGMMIGSFVVYRQLEFIRKSDLGYDPVRLLYFPARGDFFSRFDSFRSRLLANPEIAGVTAASAVPLHTATSTSGVSWEGKGPGDNILFTQHNVTYDYIETLGMTMASGRSFSRDFPSDAAEGFILNRTGARLAGLSDPVGKWFELWRQRGPIIGVVEDFHFKSLHDRIEPLVLRMYHPEMNRYVFVRLRPEGFDRGLEAVKRAYRELNPGFPLEFRFLDEALDGLYAGERRTGTVFRVFMGLALFISCLGLFGLASYTALRRTREIGIRKVLGASLPGVVWLLLKDFIRWVLIANLAAWPLSYLAMRRWLEGFAYRADLDFWLFPAAGSLALLTALLTVTSQSFKASRADPVRCLRYE